MEIKCTHLLTKDDLVESVFVKNRFMNKVLDLFFVVFSLFGLFYFIQGLQYDMELEFYVLSIFLIVSPVLVHYLMKGITFVMANWMYKMSKNTITETDYLFKDEEFTLTNDYGISTVKYEQLIKVTESNKAFYLYVNRLVFFIVSKEGLGMENTSILKAHLETKLAPYQNKLMKKK